MIPSNITKLDILNALKKIEQDGILKGRTSKKFQLIFKGKKFPPKYVISLANLYANGIELGPSEFSGGKETNNYLRRLGFKIEEISTSGFHRKISPIQKNIHKEIKSRHNERCPECKKTIEMMLRKIYGSVKPNYRFEVGTKPKDFKNHPFYLTLKEIFNKLQDYRGYKNFVIARILPYCDFFVYKPRFIIEFDESQHFSIPRKLSLTYYPNNIKLGFSKERWIQLCEEIRAKDNDPPFRDEQRAWYDTLRDFLPMINRFNPTVRIYSKEMQWCCLDTNNPGDLERFKNHIERKKLAFKNGWVATVILESYGNISSNERKNLISQITKKVTSEIEGDGVILFPGGYFSAGEKEARTLYDFVEKYVREELRKIERNIVVCIGIDGRVEKFAKDQIAVAICKRGIEAIGRKFHSAPGEEGYVDVAEGPFSKEEGKWRVFELNGRKYFLCACYDCWGIRKRGISNFGIDVILDLVHGFGGNYGKGAPYFAKLGFSWTSKLWNCFVFGAAVFSHPMKTQNWPSGVFWNQGNKSIRKWRYEDNPMKAIMEFNFNISEGKALVRIYDLGLY